jgi:hypothetical protein
MDIEVVKDKALGLYPTGGGCCEVRAVVTVDPGQSPENQRRAVVHEVLEAYFPLMPHDKICELEEGICDAIEQWETIGA